MLKDELERVNEKIEEFKQREVYPNNGFAQRLLLLRETINDTWDENISDEKGYEILKNIFGDNNVYERTYAIPSEISPKEVIKGVDNALGKISDTISEFGKPKHVEYKELLERKQKIHEIIADWEIQNIEKSY